MTEPVRVAFRTLGCKVNRVESEDIAADLLGRGARLVSENDAKVIIVNTCTVTGEADAKARKAVRHALSAGNAPVVVVTGCLAATDRAMLEALDPRIVVEPDKDRVAEAVAERLDLARSGASAVRSGPGFRTRALLKIEDGCDVFCSYCIVPRARGVPRSVAMTQVVAQVRELVAAGVAEVVLTGINLGRYRDGDADLAAVMSAVAETGVRRLRLSSIEPPDLTPRLLGAMAETPAICPHLHVPMQSASDEVLAAMRRTYTIAEFESRIAAAREALPGLAVTTDVIAGFPGETDAQAAQTAAACRRVGFSKLHVFRYSERPGTPAADLPDSIPARVRVARAAALRGLGDELRSVHLASKVGQTAEVLVEKHGGGVASGTSRDYASVAFPAADDVEVGSVVPVVVLAVEGAGLLGEMVSAPND